MLLRRIADARVFNCEDDRGRLGVKLHRYIELISVLTKRYLNRKEDEITNKITNESMNHLKEDLKKKLLDKSQCHI